MAAQPCYSGSNPITDEERAVIWKWVKDNGGVDDGAQFFSAANAINQQFYSGMAKPEWITDILSGRRTPFRQVANDLWKKQYNRRLVQQQAREIRDVANMGPAAKWIRRLLVAPRTVAVAGHGVVFPVTHAGDLVFRPASWGTFIKGTLRTYRAALVPSRFGGGKAYAGRVLDALERDALFDTALRSGVDVGAGSHPAGLISRTYHGPAQRAWDMLTVMRFELWKKQMAKFVKTGMSEAEVLDIGQNLATWANHATGSGKGPIATLGGGKAQALFGPKLTQSKLNRLVSDPVQTINTFQKMARGLETTAGERAAAWTRLSGATQWVATNLGFLAVNEGVNIALKGNRMREEDHINWKHPMRGDWMAFKGPGLHGYVPGLHTEVRTLAKILATAWSTSQERRGLSKFATVAQTAGQYAMAKLNPTYQRPLETLLGQDWQGRPLPWSKEPGTEKLPRLSYGEYAGDIGPIPLSGPIGYVYDQFQKQGMSKSDSLATVKALIVHGLSDPKTWAIGAVGAPGIHIRAESPPKVEPLKLETPKERLRQMRQGTKSSLSKRIKELRGY